MGYSMAVLAATRRINGLYGLDKNTFFRYEEAPKPNFLELCCAISHLKNLETSKSRRHISQQVAL